MEQLFSSLLSFILLYKYIALLLVFFISNVVFFMPTNALILVVGFFSTVSYFNFYWSLLIIAVANTSGDFLIYWLAKKYPEGIHARIKKQNIFTTDGLNKFLTVAAAPTIIISRVSGAFAVVVNLVSGLMAFSWIRFLIYDFIGNVLVATILLYTGFVLGVNWEQASGVVDIITIILTVLMSSLLIYNFFKKSREKINLEQ